VESSCEFANAFLASIKCWETIEWLHTGCLSSSAQLQGISYVMNQEANNVTNIILKFIEPSNFTRVVRKIRFPRSCSHEERCYVGSGDTSV
jgi:hypothetical protein